MQQVVSSVKIKTEDDGMSEQTAQCYAALLGFAEKFRTLSPPNIRLTVHCLKSVLYYKLPLNLEAKTHLQLGKLLLQYSKSEEHIRFHLDRARELGARLKAPDDTIRFEASEALADFLEKNGRRIESVCVLNDSMRSSNNNPYWHCRFLFKVAHSHILEKDVCSACECLTIGSDFASLHNADYTKGLFLLSKYMLLLSSRQIDEANQGLMEFGGFMKNVRATEYQTEALRIFYLVLQVSSFLIIGKAKSAHHILRQLHQSIQKFMGMDEAANNPNRVKEIDRFQWMPREYIVILVYLITMTQAMQNGLPKKAQRSADKALVQIDKLVVFENNPLLTLFHLHVLEHSVMGRLVMGKKTLALHDIALACRICQDHPTIMHKRRPQLHTLLGLYAMSMNFMDKAERHFNLALRLITHNNDMERLRLQPITESTGTPMLEKIVYNEPLSILICLNLALVYIRQGKTVECSFLTERMCSVGSQILDSCHCLRAASCYVQAFQAFYENRLQEAKQLLNKTVQLSQDEELNRLSASAYVTVGQIHLNEQNIQDGQKKIMCAFEAANKMPDIGILLWATALLKDVANLAGNQNDEKLWFTEHEKLSKNVIDEHVQAMQAHDNHLLDWLDGPIPDGVPAPFIAHPNTEAVPSVIN